MDANTSIRELMLALAGDDPAACIRASHELAERSIPDASNEAEFEDRIQAYHAEIAAALAAPGFPTEATLSKLLDDFQRLQAPSTEEERIIRHGILMGISQVLGSVGTAGVPFLNRFLDLLESPTEEDGMKSLWNGIIGCKALQSMGHAGLPGFEAVFEAYLREGERHHLKTLIHFCKLDESKLGWLRHRTLDPSQPARHRIIDILGTAMRELPHVDHATTLIALKPFLESDDLQEAVSTADAFLKAGAMNEEITELIRVIRRRSKLDQEESELPEVNLDDLEGKPVEHWLSCLLRDALSDEFSRAINVLSSESHALFSQPQEDDVDPWRATRLDFKQRLLDFISQQEDPANYINRLLKKERSLLRTNLEELARMGDGEPFDNQPVLFLGSDILTQILRLAIPRYPECQDALLEAVRTCGPSDVEMDSLAGIVAACGDIAQPAAHLVTEHFLTSTEETSPPGTLESVIHIARWSDATVARLIQAVDEEPASRQEAAATVLGELGARALPAIPALLRALQHAEGLTKAAFTYALRRLAPLDQRAAQAVDNLRNDAHDDVRMVTIIGGKDESPTTSQQKHLLDQLTDPSPMVRATAAEALGRYPAVPQVVEALINLLDDQDVEPDFEPPAYEALHSLSQMGRASFPAVPKVIQLMNDCFIDEQARDLKNINDDLTGIARESESPWAVKDLAGFFAAVGDHAASAIPILTEFQDYLTVRDASAVDHRVEQIEAALESIRGGEG